MLLKKLIIGSLLIVGTSSPLLVEAHPLTVANHTHRDSTSRSNNGFCSSTVLGKDGITRAGQTHTISDNQLKLACFPHLHECVTNIYMTDNCSGPIVAKVVFDVDKGLISKNMIDQSYDISPASGFDIAISGGPQLKA